MSTTVGGIESFIRLRDDFTSKIDAIIVRLDKLESTATRTTRKTTSETDKARDAYNKLTASLDPAIAREQKLEKAQEVLNNALKRGVVDQNQYARALDQAKSKYSDLTHHTLTWREEIHHLTDKISGLSNVMGPFGREATHALEGIASRATSAGTALSTLASSGPALIGVAAAIVALAGAFVVFETLKTSVEFISEAVSEGLKFQLIVDRLNKTLITNGSVSELSARQLIQLAESMELVVAKSKEEIVAAEIVLSRFDHLGGDVFPKALKSSLAFSKVTGETADVAAKRLGPALEGNSKSLASLKEIGIVFTTSQKKTLQQMIETGNITQYQSTLFAILDEKIGTVSNTLDKNLTRQATRAHLVLGEFKEGIANEVIPALEDLAQDLVDGLGGWENIKKVVQEVGRFVGNIIRVMVYDVIILYHSWMENNDILVASISGAMAEIVAIFNRVGKFMSNVPALFGGGDQWKAVTNLTVGVEVALRNVSATAVKGAKAQEEGAKKAWKALSDHKTALEGDEKAYKKLGSAIDGVSAAELKLQKLLETYQDLLKAHETTKQKQLELLALYKDSNIAIFDQEQGVKRINDKYADQALYEKYIKEFQELGAAKAKEIAAHLVQINQEERKRTEEIDRSLIKITAQRDRAKDYHKAVIAIGKAWDDAVTPGINESIEKLKFWGTGVANMEEFLSRVKSLTEDIVTEEEKRNKALAETLRLLQLAVELGKLTPQQAGEVRTNVLRQNATPLFTQAEEEWRNFVDQVLDGTRSVASRTKEYIANLRKIEAVYAEFPEIVAAVEAEISRVQLDNIVSYAQGWQEFFSVIGGLFGGFAAKAASTLQRIISTYQSLSSAGSSLSSLGGLAGSFGGYVSAAAPFLAIATTAISMQRESIARQRQQRYTSSAELGIGTGEFDLIGNQGRAAAKAIEDAVQPFLDLFGSTLSDLPALSIRVREDGKKFELMFNNMILQSFNSMEDAQNALALAAIDYLAQSHAISATMQQVIDQSKGRGKNQDADRLLKELNFADWYDKLGFGDLGSKFIDDFRKYSQALDEAARLGLDAARITDNYNKSVDALKNSLFGVDTSASNALDALLGLSRAMAQVGEQQRADIEQRLVSARSELAELRASGPRTLENGRRESQDMFDRAVADLERSVDQYTRDLEKIPKALSDQEIDLGIWTAFERYLKDNAKYSEMATKFAQMRVQIEFDIIKLKLIELGKWEEWAAVFNDAFNNAMAAAGEASKPHRGGGNRQNEREGVLDFLRSREISLMGDLSGQLAGLNDEYNDEIKAAGKNKDLIAKLVDMREREIVALRDQTRAQLLTPYLGGAYAGSRSDFDRQRLDINKAYDDYRANARALGEAIWKINAAEKERLHLLGLEASAAAGSKTAATILEFQNLGQTISFLRDHAEELGVSFGDLMDELQGEQFIAFGDRLLSFVDKYYGDTAGFEQFRMDLERVRFELELANMHLQFKLLKDLGLLTDKTIAAVEGIFNFVDNHPVNWSQFIGIEGPKFKGYGDDAASSLSTTIDKVNDDLSRLADSFKKAKESILETLNSISRGDLGIVSPEDALTAARQQYMEAKVSADSGNLKGFEAIPDAAKNYIEVLKRFSPALAAVELPDIKNVLSRLSVATTVKDENLIYTEKFVQAQDLTNKTLANGFNDVSNSLNTQNVIQLEVVDKLTQISSNQSELNARLSRLESGNVGQKRSA